jgi:ABC-type sugar transport system ATPase subunit
MTQVLEARNVQKAFGTIQALRPTSFSVAQGEIRALCGENGAGKSTLVKLLTGIHRPDAGEILVDGVARHYKSSRDSQADGIAFVSQELSIIPHLSVLDNVLLGHRDVPFLHRRASLRRQAAEALEVVGLDQFALGTLAAELSLGEWQLLEIARMLARKARVLLLDEPTATLSDGEIERVFAALRRVRGLGCSVIFITHRLAEVFEICDNVTVLRNGAEVATLPIAQVDRESLIEMMLGRSLGQMYPPAGSPSAETGLAVSNLAVPGIVHALSFQALRGQVVCLSGQIGSGASEAVRALAGLVYNATGRVMVGGRPMRLGSVGEAVRANVRFVSEDRAGEGIFLDLPVRLNLLASQLERIATAGFISQRKLDQLAHDACVKVALDPARLSSTAGDLSGGNQQKIAVARSLTDSEFGVLLLNEPTRGVDVGARAEIYGLMRRVCDQGFCIVMMSTDIEEVAGMADVVITMFKGRQVARYARPDISRNRLLSDITHSEQPLEKAV